MNSSIYDIMRRVNQSGRSANNNHGEHRMFKTSMLRSTSAIVLVSFTMGTLQPAWAAVRTPAAPKTADSAITKSATADDEYTEALQQLTELTRAAKKEGSATLGQRIRAMREQLRRLESLEGRVDDAFLAVEKNLDQKALAQIIKDRHKAAEQEYKQKRKEIKRLAKDFEDGDDAGDSAKRDQGVKDLDAFLTANRSSRTYKKLDPNKLPWRVVDATTRAPAESAEEFAKHLAAPKAMAEAQAKTLAKAAPAPTPPVPADLAATDEVQLTQPIRDLAASLNNDPVTIYNWVRNNIEYVPTFGSIQGSDVTLSKRKGNAFDTASLLIALYRASGVPSRYVHGTIVVPAAAAANWVGNVTNPQAAQQLLGQGGVPNAGLVTSGQISHIKLEHVWVEAWVDHVPSKGRKSRQADSWVPLDASYKQYTYTEGLITQVDTGIDAAAVRTAFTSSAVVNEADGWVQNANGGAASSAAETYLRKLNEHVRNTKPGATNGDVFGSRKVVKQEINGFAGALPYSTLVVGARYADLPAALTHKFRYRVYASEYDQAFDSPMMSFEDSLPNLAGKKVTLFYAPATQADQDLIASYMPKPHADGTPPTPDEFKAFSLPAYLVRLKPELRVDGVVRATGTPITMGTDLPASGAFTTYDLSRWDETSDLLTAGQATAIGLNIQGIEKRQLDQAKTRMEQARAKIQAGDVSGLTGDGVSGDIITTTIWSYFSTVDHGGNASKGLSRMVDLPGLSFGLAHVDIDVTYSFGFARSAKPSGILLDVGHLRNVRWSKDNDRNAWVQYNRTVGQYASAMEHHVPELLFVTPTTPAEGISAVKLLAKAAAAGQKIFTVTAANIDRALPQISLRSDTVNEIRAAVLAGKEVTVHERPVEVNGWTGAGYTVIDTETGAGGYLLDGGANGGKLLAAISGFLVGLIAGIYLVALIGALLTGGATLGAFLAVAFIIAAIVFIISTLMALFSDEDTYSCYAGGASAGFGLALIWAPLTRAVQAIALIFGWTFVVNNAVTQCI